MFAVVLVFFLAGPAKFCLLASITDELKKKSIHAWFGFLVIV